MPTIEDSYDGALRQLRALGHEPPLRIPPPPITRRPAPIGRPKLDEERARLEARMLDLEELAEVACDENEQLKAELFVVREENERLHRRIATLENVIANPRDVLGLPALPASFDEERPLPPARGGSGAGAVVLMMGLVAVMLGAVLLVRAEVRDLRTAMSMAAVVQDLRCRVTEAWARAIGTHPRYGRSLLDEPPAAAPVVAPVDSTPSPRLASPTHAPAAVPSGDVPSPMERLAIATPDPKPAAHHSHRRSKGKTPFSPPVSPEL